MRRRRVLASTLGILALSAGCLESITDKLSAHDEVDLDWTPAPPTESSRESADALAYVPMHLEGCAPSLDSPSSVEATVTDRTDVTATLITDAAGASTLQSAIETCALNDHEPDEVATFIEQTAFEAAVIVAIVGVGPTVTFVGIRPDGALVVAVDAAPGDGRDLVLVRVGYWNDPTELILEAA